MKAIKTVGLVLAVLVALFVGVGLALPRDLTVEESISVQAPVSQVWKLVGTLQAHEAWSPWKKMDPGMVAVYSGPTLGIGQTSEWNTEKSGKGKQVVTEYVENELVAMDLDFYDRGRGKAAIGLEPGERDVKVVWSYYGEADNLIARYFQKFLAEPMLHEAYASGLADLKVQVEALPVDEPAAVADATAPVEGTSPTHVSEVAE